MAFLGIRHRSAEQAVFHFTISANADRWNVLTEIGYTPGVPVVVNITVNASILVLDTLLGSPTQAMNLSGLLSGSTVNLTNLGYIQGQGGAGGAGGTLIGSNGSAGGTAIKGPGSGRTFNVTNGSGNIWGGGGGAGGGGGCGIWNPGDSVYDLHGGGGGGGGGAGGSNGGSGATSTGGPANGVAGGAGTTGAAGAGGSGGNGGDNPNGGDGGNGGAFGASGANGGAGTKHGGGGGGSNAGGTGGAAGKAIDLNGGTINWISGSGSPNVKGAVS